MYLRCITILVILLCLPSVTYSKPEISAPNEKQWAISGFIFLSGIADWQETDTGVLITLNDYGHKKLSRFSFKYCERLLNNSCNPLIVHCIG